MLAPKTMTAATSSSRMPVLPCARPSVCVRAQRNVAPVEKKNSALPLAACLASALLVGAIMPDDALAAKR